MKKILCIGMLLIAVWGQAQNDALFEEGKSLYKAENYQEAINTWLKIVASKEHSAELYFNIGNAYYKLNNIGPSVYYYEKALLLNPNDKDILNNLNFAENARIDAIEPLPKTIFKRWYETISGIFSFDGWAIAATFWALFFVLAFLLYYFSVSEKRKRILFTTSIFGIFILMFSFVMAFKTYDDFSKTRVAIIFAESVEVKSEPTLGSQAAFILHEGTKVQILDQDEQWFRIVLADGKDGWIPSSALKEL